MTSATQVEITAAQARLDEFTAEFERRFAGLVFTYEDGQPNPRTAPSGDLYAEYMFFGDSADNVLNTTKLRLTDIADRASAEAATLYWRIRPEIDRHPHKVLWKTYCRFIISNKPRKT
jgi:hypothetical protein